MGKNKKKTAAQQPGERPSGERPSDERPSGEQPTGAAPPEPVQAKHKAPSAQHPVDDIKSLTKRLEMAESRADAATAALDEANVAWRARLAQVEEEARKAIAAAQKQAKEAQAAAATASERATAAERAAATALATAKGTLTGTCKDEADDGPAAATEEAAKLVASEEKDPEVQRRRMEAEDELLRRQLGLAPRASQAVHCR